MMGSFLTRVFLMILGYVYPAYECYKTVELDEPEIEQLRFWCQYWILVAVLTGFERVGDTFISWLPMYSEAKLAFFVYLWYPKTRGTTYVYETFFRPFMAKHETEIDRSLLELRTRASDIMMQYWQKAWSYGQTRFFEILQYFASQSQAPRTQPAQQQQRHQSQQVYQAHPAAPARQPAAFQEPQRPDQAPPSPSKSQLQEQPTKVGGLSLAAEAARQPQASSAPSPGASGTVSHTAPSKEPTLVDAATSTSKEVSNPPAQETAMEEAIRMTRGRLKRRAAMVVRV